DRAAVGDDAGDPVPGGHHATCQRAVHGHRAVADGGVGEVAGRLYGLAVAVDRAEHRVRERAGGGGQDLARLVCRQQLDVEAGAPRLGDQALQGGHLGRLAGQVGVAAPGELEVAPLAFVGPAVTGGAGQGDLGRVATL